MSAIIQTAKGGIIAAKKLVITLAVLLGMLVASLVIASPSAADAGPTSGYCPSISIAAGSSGAGYGIGTAITVGRGTSTPVKKHHAKHGKKHHAKKRHAKHGKKHHAKKRHH